MSGPRLQVFDSQAMTWEDRFVPELGKTLFVKRFLEDPESGVTVRLVKYPAGFTNSWHTHPCAHGMFVLEGTLVTHEGRFGPGNFVWFPEGMMMQHGASQEEDVTVLFLTNKKFEIRYALSDKRSQEDLAGQLESPGWRLTGDHPDETVTGTLEEVLTESHSRKSRGEHPGKIEQMLTSIEIDLIQIEQLWQHLGLPTI